MMTYPIKLILAWLRFGKLLAYRIILQNTNYEAPGPWFIHRVVNQRIGQVNGETPMTQRRLIPTSLMGTRSIPRLHPRRRSFLRIQKTSRTLLGVDRVSIGINPKAQVHAHPLATTPPETTHLDTENHRWHSIPMIRITHSVSTLKLDEALSMMPSAPF